MPIHDFLPVLGSLGLMIAAPAGAPASADGAGAGGDRVQASVLAEEPFHTLATPFRPDRPAQVRIERRVIIRIAPSLVDPATMFAQMPRPAPAAKFTERKMGKCLDPSDIVAIRPYGEGQMMFYMNDRTLVGASFDRSCRTRMFYAGGYVEQGPDGKMCAERDRLLSRAGAACTVTRFRRLKPAD